MDVLRSKKALIFVFSSLFSLMLLIVIWYVSTLRTQNSLQSKQELQSIVTSSPLRSALTSPTQAVRKQTATQSYNVLLPLDWEMRLKKIASGGTQDEIVIPNGSYQNARDAQIIIQGTNAQVTPLSQVEGVFTALGYSKSLFKIDNIPARVFSGSIELESQRLWEIAVVFQKSDMVYFVKLSYVAEVKNQLLETDFYKTLMTMRFTQNQ